jgi:serine O-acetyltransferase
MHMSGNLEKKVNPYVERALALRWHAARLYRVADRLHSSAHPTLAYVVSVLNRLITGVEIEPGAKFGPGLSIGHGLGTVVNAGVVAGADCSIYQQVTLGLNLLGGNSRVAPIIGDRVTIFPGAKVIGGVRIGDDAIIGANAVILDDVPARARIKAGTIVPRTRNPGHTSYKP